MEPARRFVDSGWRLTIPKAMRQSLGWAENTLVCLHWDGFEITIKAPFAGCSKCPDTVSYTHLDVYKRQRQPGGRPRQVSS